MTNSQKSQLTMASARRHSLRKPNTGQDQTASVIQRLGQNCLLICRQLVRTDTNYMTAPLLSTSLICTKQPRDLNGNVENLRGESVAVTSLRQRRRLQKQMKARVGAGRKFRRSVFASRRKTLFEHKVASSGQKVT